MLTNLVAAITIYLATNTETILLTHAVPNLAPPGCWNDLVYRAEPDTDPATKWQKISIEEVTRVDVPGFSPAFKTRSISVSWQQLRKVVTTTWVQDNTNAPSPQADGTFIDPNNINTFLFRGRLTNSGLVFTNLNNGVLTNVLISVTNSGIIR